MSRRRISFSNEAAQELEEWTQKAPRTANKIISLALECTRTPGEGTGKPKQLTGDFAGYYSRRITQGDRLVYKVTGEEIFIYSCKGHYDDK